MKMWAILGHQDSSWLTAGYLEPTSPVLISSVIREEGAWHSQTQHCGLTHLKVSPKVLDMSSIVSNFAVAWIWVKSTQGRVEEESREASAYQRSVLWTNGLGFLSLECLHALSYFQFFLCKNMALPKKLLARATDRSKAKIKKSKKSRNWWFFTKNGDFP